jgi:hypothetical protein
MGYCAQKFCTVLKDENGNPIPHEKYRRMPEFTRCPGCGESLKVSALEIDDDDEDQKSESYAIKRIIIN